MSFYYYNLKSEDAEHSEETSSIFDFNKNVINMMNKLTVPGTIEAVSKCSLFLGSHSSMNIAAWHYKQPCIVLYDQATQKRHFQRTDKWSFGKDFRNTRHGLFTNFSVEID